MRVYAISDLHTDFKENRLLVERLPTPLYEKDTIIVAGDISDSLEVIEWTLDRLRSRFAHVFYVPGNHELWVRTENYDSVEKLQRIFELCRRLDVRTEPARVRGVWIVPLLSWYHSDFDSAADADDDETELEGWADFYFCKWPVHVTDVCRYFLDMNEAKIKAYDAPVISFSHFLPRPDLLPPRERLKFKNLPQVSGCSDLETQIRRLKSVVHVFGHSHIRRDCVLDDVRYVHNPLLYPKERAGADFPAKIIWDSEEKREPGTYLQLLQIMWVPC